MVCTLRYLNTVKATAKIKNNVENFIFDQYYNIIIYYSFHQAESDVIFVR